METEGIAQLAPLGKDLSRPRTDNHWGLTPPLTGGTVERAAFGDEASEKGLTPTWAGKSGLLIHLMSLLEPPRGSIRGTEIPDSRSSVAYGFFKHFPHGAVQLVNPCL